MINNKVAPPLITVFETFHFLFKNLNQLNDKFILTLVALSVNSFFNFFIILLFFLQCKKWAKQFDWHEAVLQ